VARIAAGTSHGLAQSIFQVGGNLGSSLGPLTVVFIVLPRGLGSLAWFCLSAALAMSILIGISRWYAHQTRTGSARRAAARTDLSPGRIWAAILVLTLLMLSKTFYLASFDSFYQFYLTDKFAVSPRDAQLALFAFLAAVAAGTLAGGPVGDRIGRKKVLWGSILGVLPFTLILPHVGLAATIGLSLVIGFVMASAFSAIVVFAQSLMPHRIGMISGVFFGLLFGFGGLGAALIGALADQIGIQTVYQLCAFLPAMGLLTVFLPDTKQSPGG
jgi:FSR family fosmidomycin resistance protein-like MFS transporter